MITLRRAAEGDLGAIAAIQAASPEAAQWSVRDYLAHDCRVAIGDDGVVAGFLVCRAVAGDEHEVLNIAVQSEFRRHGIARRMLEEVCNGNLANYFLEVRASNKAARAFYSVMGFTEVGIREAYYENPPESGIVMKRSSCYRHNCQETARGRQV